MMVIDLLKEIEKDYICISKKIGLYLKNSDEGELYTYIKDIVEENYINDLDKNMNFRTELIEYLNDPYYKDEIKKDISKYNNKQLISLITKKCWF